MLFDTTTSARCLDGSPAGYYRRAGRGSGASTFLIELEGGGWCVSLDDCVSRSKTDLGSSAAWPKTGSPTMDGGSHGLFSNDCTVNPHWCNATMIHVNYCDGASFAGHVDSVVNASATNLYFRGSDVLNSTLMALVQTEGMESATSVVLKGCSAGGLAVILHLDFVAEFVRSVAPSAVVVGVPDAGYFLDHNDTAGHSSYTPLYKWVANTQRVTGGVDAGCVAAYSATPDELWRCFMAQVRRINSVTSTHFQLQAPSLDCLLQHMYDSRPRSTPRAMSRLQPSSPKTSTTAGK